MPRILPVLVLLVPFIAAAEDGPAPLKFTVKLETVLKHDGPDFLWYHPRAASIPGLGRDGQPAVILTLQKHLHTSDHYSGLSIMRSDDLGRTWTAPDPRPELDWRKESDAVDIAVADVTPGWHAKTKRLLAIGAQVRYSKKGEQLDDKPRSHITAYTVFDPAANRWAVWKSLEVPVRPEFSYSCSGCAQFVVEPDGHVLVPFYYGPNDRDPFSVTVARCAFDGTELKYVSHGTELVLKDVRGLVEPSLIRHGDRCFLTLRNDLRGYLTTSKDGLEYAPITPWKFDDGQELGSYNTQQHWLAHGRGLFLVYTRKGANNDHIPRHRAPLFIAQVDPERLAVIRRTEQVLIPERGAEMGNFGAAPISDRESWVTVAEGLWTPDSRTRGAEGAVFVARILWEE